MSDSWCLIESDPAVFTELIQKFGVKDIAVEEVVSLDSDCLNQYNNVYGLIFLYKWRSELKAPSAENTMPDAPVFFAKQVIQNACATLAIINTLYNYPDTIDLGDQLKSFLSFTQDFDPELRGAQLQEYDPIRNAHNSFATPQAFALDDTPAKDGDDVYHFVSFIFRHGSVWELDGLQNGPIARADATKENYKAVMVDVVQQRMAEIAAKDTSGRGQGISFSLMAVVDDPLTLLEKKIAELRGAEQPVSAYEEELALKRAERSRGHSENVRRCHNYNPMLVALLRALAEKGALDPIVDELKANK